MSSTETPSVIDVREDSFEAEVLERSKQVPVLVDFWAPWCQPCRLLGPILEKSAQESGGAWVLAKVNVDENERLAAAFRIQGIPAVIAFRDERPVNQFSGVISEEQLQEFLASLLPSEADQLAAEASEAGDESDEDREAKFREALESDPTHVESLVGLASLLVEKGALDEVPDLVERAGDGGEAGEELAQVKARLFLLERGAGVGAVDELRAQAEGESPDPNVLLELGIALARDGDYESALATLLEAASSDKAFARERVREPMVHIFYLVGSRSELADDYRSRLSSLLY